MRAYVYTDKSLERYAGQFVWLSVNTEASSNAAFLKRYPIPALPTLLVLDPKGKVTTRYVGGATVPQLRKLLDEASAGAVSAPDKLLVQADRLAAEGKHAEAVKVYESALAKSDKSWRRYGRTAESMLFSMSMADQNEPCAIRAAAMYPRVKGTASAANVASTGLSCALALEETNAKRATLAETLEQETREVFDDPKITLSGDDRSGLYIALIDARDQAKDEKGAHELREQWAAFLERMASEAKTAEQRAVYDSHRVAAYLDLGTPEKAIPMLEQSERDFPGDYNPPARLALAYKAMKQYDKALAASDRALARVYGPRKISVMTTRADIYTAMGNKDAARATIQAAIEYVKSLPDQDSAARRIASLQKRLDSIQ
jgi:predicted negative regulator of RcsB-dependent stress response